MHSSSITKRRWLIIARYHHITSSTFIHNKAPPLSRQFHTQRSQRLLKNYNNYNIDNDNINHDDNNNDDDIEDMQNNWRENDINANLKNRSQNFAREKPQVTFADDDQEEHAWNRQSALSLPFSGALEQDMEKQPKRGSFAGTVKRHLPIDKHDAISYVQKTTGDALSSKKEKYDALKRLKQKQQKQQKQQHLTKKEKKQRKSKTWSSRPLEDERYVEMEKRTEKLMNSLSAEEKRALSDQITPEKLKNKLMPFDQPELNHAFMTGRLLSKDVEDKLYFVEDQKTGDVDLIYTEDPHWLKFTMAMMSPFPSSSVNDPRKKVLERTETDPERFFLKIDKSTGLPRAKDVKNYNFLMMAQGFQGKMALMLQTYKRMRQEGVQPDARTFSTMVNAFAKRGNYVVSYRIFEELITKTDIKPTQQIFAAIVNALVQAKKIDQAFHVMESMRAYDLEPSTAVHTTLIAGCILVGDLPRAWEHFELMVSQYSPPNEITYTIMINAAAEDGRVEKAFSLLADMEQLGLYPNEVAYNTLIKACSQRRDMYQKAFEVAKQMHSLGHEPDIFTYNTLIHICGRQGDVDKAYELLETMKSKGITPNAVTYNSVINLFGNTQFSNTQRRRQNLENALALFDQMIENNVSIDQYTMNCTLKCFAYALYENDAMEFFETEFENYNVKRNSMTYSIMIRMYVQLRRMSDALVMVERMENDALEDKSLRLTYDAYKHVALGFAKTGEHKKAFQWLRDMHEKYKYMLTPVDMKQFKMSITGNRSKAYEREKIEELKWLDDIVDDSSRAMTATVALTRTQHQQPQQQQQQRHRSPAKLE